MTRPRFLLALSGAATALAITPTGGMADAPSFSASGVVYNVQVASMAVTNLTYAGTYSLTTAAGTVAVVEFTASSATSNGLKQYTPCIPVDGTELIYVTEANVAATPNGVAFYATSLSYDGLATPWGPANTPAAGTVLVSSGNLTNLTMTLAGMSAPNLTLTTARSYAAFCTSGTAAARPAPSQAPKASPAPSTTPPWAGAPSPSTAPDWAPSPPSLWQH